MRIAALPGPLRIAIVSDSSGRRDRRNQSTSIGGEGEAGTHRVLTTRVTVDDAPHHAVLTDQVDALGVHQQPEARVARRLVGHEVEEVPLRHEGDEGKAGVEAAEGKADL